MLKLFNSHTVLVAVPNPNVSTVLVAAGTLILLVGVLGCSGLSSTATALKAVA